MTLRARLLLLFGALAVVPLLGVGLLDYLRSISALERLIGLQTKIIASRSASEIGDRWGVIEANLSLLAENEEALRLYPGAAKSGDWIGRDSAVAFIGDLVGRLGPAYGTVVYRDTSGSEILRLPSVKDRAGAGSPVHADYPVRAYVRDPGGKLLGSVELQFSIDSILYSASLNTGFGRSGWSLVTDTLGQRVVYASGQPLPRAVILAAPLLSQWRSKGRRVDGFLVFKEGDSSRLASVGSPSGLAPFRVFSVGNIDEFSGSFARIRASNLALLLVITAAATALFVLFLWRATDSLSLLTKAADEVGRGNLEPLLPRVGDDEVGKLSSAFGFMINRVRETMKEIEHSRQMVVVGEFASQITHEIRNPLTSIKLNLQRVERLTSNQTHHPELVDPVRISLREIQRVDRILRGALRLGRTPSHEPTVFMMRDAVVAAIEAVKPLLERNGVHLDLNTEQPSDPVWADRASIEGVFVNLLINAAEASAPEGGRVRVVCATGQRNGVEIARITISDTGPGVPAESRELIFKPFYSTKVEGSGLGLAIAQRAVEEHHGRLNLEEVEDGIVGAAFSVELPLIKGSA